MKNMVFWDVEPCSLGRWITAFHQDPRNAGTHLPKTTRYHFPEDRNVDLKIFRISSHYSFVYFQGQIAALLLTVCQLVSSIQLVSSEDYMK
jgi:hypothetical protein